VTCYEVVSGKLEDQTIDVTPMTRRGGTCGAETLTKEMLAHIELTCDRDKLAYPSGFAGVLDDLGLSRSQFETRAAAGYEPFKRIPTVQQCAIEVQSQPDSGSGDLREVMFHITKYVSHPLERCNTYRTQGAASRVACTPPRSNI